MDEVLMIYHGSERIIERPVYGAGKNNNDYGRGFYCTEHPELAKEWACSNPDGGFMNRYELDTHSLTILDLNSDDFGILNWLAVLLDNRIIRLDTPLSVSGRQYLLQYFLPEYKSYDIITGYRADDSYFSFARAFLNNQISLRQLSKAMRLGKLGYQIVIKSEKAFGRLSYIGYEVAEAGIYYIKRKNRDLKARNDYMEELAKEDLNGVFMRDILREQMRPDDKRLYPLYPGTAVDRIIGENV